MSLAPQIPFLTDDMEQVLEAAWDAGARSAFYHVLRLPWEVSPLFRQWLETALSAARRRVMARIQDMRGGKDYDSDFATRMKGSGAWAELIGQRFPRPPAGWASIASGWTWTPAPVPPARRRPGQAALF